MDFEYIVWCCFDNRYKPQHKLYKQNEEKTWWLDPSSPNSGFDVKTVEGWKPRFSFFNTEEEAKEFIRIKEWESRHGEQPEVGDEDFSCPSCSRRYIGGDVFSDCYEVDESPYNVECLCGTHLTVTPCVRITYSVKEKTK